MPERTLADVGARRGVDIAALLIAVAVAVVVGIREAPGYGFLILVIAFCVVERVIWLPLLLLLLARWVSGGWNPIIVSLAVLVAVWWLIRLVLVIVLRPLVEIYLQEKALGDVPRGTEGLRLEGTLRTALLDADSRLTPGMPVSSAHLLVSIIRTSAGVAWGPLGGLDKNLIECDEPPAAAPIKVDGVPVLLSAPAAKALRLATHLAREYQQPAGAALAAVAIILEGVSAGQLLCRTGISTGEALEILQGSPLGGELEDLDAALAEFDLVEQTIEDAMGADMVPPVTQPPWRPRVVNVVAVPAALLVLSASVVSVAEVPDRLQDRDQLKAAIDDLRSGHRDEALIRLDSLYSEYPDSTVVLVAMACSLWDIGYQDHAMLTYAALLSMSFPYQRADEGCFVHRPDDYGIRIAQFGGAVRPYVANSDDDTESELLHLLTRASDQEASWWQAELVLACLNHRHDLKLLAAVNLQKAELAYAIAEDNGGARRGIEVPRHCLDMAEEYRVTEGTDGPIPVPRDAESRFYMPGQSPVPRPGEPALREVENGT